MERVEIISRNSDSFTDRDSPSPQSHYKDGRRSGSPVSSPRPPYGGSEEMPPEFQTASTDGNPPSQLSREWNDSRLPREILTASQIMALLHCSLITRTVEDQPVPRPARDFHMEGVKRSPKSSGRLPQVGILRSFLVSGTTRGCITKS